jgi:hypothetical protein
VHANNVVPTRRTRRYQATPTRRANRGTPGILQLSGLALHRGAALHSQPRTSTRPLMFVTHWWRLQRQSAVPPIACRPFRPLAAVSAPATSTRRSRRSTCQPTSLPAHQLRPRVLHDRQRFHFSGVVGVSRTCGQRPSGAAVLTCRWCPEYVATACAQTVRCCEGTSSQGAFFAVDRISTRGHRCTAIFSCGVACIRRGQLEENHLL